MGQKVGQNISIRIRIMKVPVFRVGEVISAGKLNELSKCIAELERMVRMQKVQPGKGLSMYQGMGGVTLSVLSDGVVKPEEELELKGKDPIEVVDVEEDPTADPPIEEDYREVRLKVSDGYTDWAKLKVNASGQLYIENGEFPIGGKAVEGVNPIDVSDGAVYTVSLKLSPDYGDWARPVLAADGGLRIETGDLPNPGPTYKFDEDWFIVDGINISLKTDALNAVVDEAVAELSLEVQVEGLVEVTEISTIKVNKTTMNSALDNLSADTNVVDTGL